MSEITFRTFEEPLAPDFKRLNLEWIQKYFAVEPHDLEQLDHPREYIIHPGGEIVFALLDGQVVGVCALIKTGSEEFELAKMAVSSDFQGRQIGLQLGRQAIEEARRMGARRIWLASNRQLKSALHVYEKLGFREFTAASSPYARTDIFMELLLDASV
jgi:GNAT superfamily N-acetyltransferase